jgi:hypothetical protein
MINMRFRPVVVRVAVLTGMVLACFAGSSENAVGCAYHGSGAGALIFHPGSIDVASAVEIAEQAGIIAPQPGPAAASLVAYHRTVKRIEQFRTLIEAGGTTSTPAFSLVLIESALWSRFTPNPAGLMLAIHTSGPNEDEPVVLSNGGVIQSVLDGRLSAADALHRGLIRVEAAIDAKLALFELLAAPRSHGAEHNGTPR